MSKRPPSLPLDPFGRTHPPANLPLDRYERVRLLRQAAEVLLSRRDRASLFVGSAISAWLTQGGSLERDFLKVTGERGSHETAAAIARRQRGDY